MLQHIVGIGADEYTMGTKTVGSMLVTGMKLAGN
jgi:PmbA protein